MKYLIAYKAKSDSIQKEVWIEADTQDAAIANFNEMYPSDQFEFCAIFINAQKQSNEELKSEEKA